MTDLPINISNVPAKAAAGKPSSNDNVAQQDGQDFGNVLARQVADSAKPDESPILSLGDAIIEAAKQDTADIAPAVSASSLPADMLAALLAQQNPAVAPPPDVNIQPVLNAQIAAGASGVSDKEASAPLALIGENINGNINSSNTSIPVLGTALPKVESAIKSSNGFADTFNALGMKELSPSTSNQSLHGSVINELATSAQQPGLPPLFPGAAAPSSPISISTPVTQAAWGDEFSQKITWIATQRNQSAELHLNPPQLGPLDVVLKISGDQASAIFTSPHAAVRDAIEQALPKLREMLADSGIMLGNATVNDQAAKNNQDNSSRKPQGGTPTSVSGGATEAASIQETRVSSISRHNGMVDTFA